MLEVHQFPCLSDNYGYLLHDSASGETVCIDTPDADEYLKQAAAKGWQITQIWNTPGTRTTPAATVPSRPPPAARSLPPKAMPARSRASTAASIKAIR